MFERVLSRKRSVHRRQRGFLSGERVQPGAALPVVGACSVGGAYTAGGALPTAGRVPAVLHSRRQRVRCRGRCMMGRRRGDRLARMRGGHAGATESCGMRGRGDRRVASDCWRAPAPDPSSRLPRAASARRSAPRGARLIAVSCCGVGLTVVAAGAAIVADVGRVVDDGLVVDVRHRNILEMLLTVLL